MATILIRRGTRAEVDAAATAGELFANEPIWITDDEVYAVGTSTTTYKEVGPIDLSGFTTTDLTEGTNLYFTDARAKTAVDKAHVDSLNVDADTVDGAHVDPTSATGLMTRDDGDGRYGRLDAFNQWTSVNEFQNTIRTASNNANVWFEIQDSQGAASSGARARRAIIRPTPNVTDAIEFLVYDSADGTFDLTRYQIFKDRLAVPTAVVVGSPTGGSQGAGTVNAEGLFVNGVAVGSGGNSDINIDGGAPDSVYTAAQVIDGGAP